MKFLTVATIAMLLSSGAAFAQTAVPDPFKPDGGARAPTVTPGPGPSNPSAVAQNAMPTAAQCTAGYQSGMSWTRDEFMKACAQMKGGK